MATVSDGQGNMADQSSRAPIADSESKAIIGRGTLAVSGAAAAAGTIVFAGRKITGTLGGRSIE